MESASGPALPRSGSIRTMAKSARLHELLAPRAPQKPQRPHRSVAGAEEFRAPLSKIKPAQTQYFHYSPFRT